MLAKLIVMFCRVVFLAVTTFTGILCVPRVNNDATIYGLAYVIAGPASVSLQALSSDTCEEDVGSIEVCAVISGLPTGGLGCDVVVTLAVDDGTAGNDHDCSIVRGHMLAILLSCICSFPRRFHICITT